MYNRRNDRAVTTIEADETSDFLVCVCGGGTERDREGVGRLLKKDWFQTTSTSFIRRPWHPFLALDSLVSVKFSVKCSRNCPLESKSKGQVAADASSYITLTCLLLLMCCDKYVIV